MNYLYNGVEFPAIPTWNKEKYPYLFIHENPGIWITLWAIDVPLTKGGEYLKTNGPYGYYYWVLKDGVWAVTEYSEGTNAEGSSWGTNLIWANHDILKEDGTIYLAASDPIPVGGGEPIDKASFLQGYIVGRRLAGMR